MKVLWATLQLLSGVVLILGLCVTAMALVFPGLITHMGELLAADGLAAGFYWVSQHRVRRANASTPC